jgi:hypothetical protein
VELVAILRVLWAHRILVALGAVVAIAAGLMVARGETTSVGVASTRIVLDTPDSQLLLPVTKGADSLGWRAALLANLTASQSVREDIADEVGIRPDRLVVIEPLLTTPTVRTALAPRALEAAEHTTADYVLTVRFDPELPIISVEALAPDRRAATRLAEAATGALTAAAKAPPDTRGKQGLVVNELGTPRTRAIVSGPGRAMPVAVTVVLFGFWCACVALGAGMARAWRAADRPVQPA